MTSPFAPFVNALLRFSVASGELQEDRHGNLRPGRAVVEVEAVLKQTKAPKTETNPGVPARAIFVEGYITRVGSGPNQPQPLPSVITPDSQCQIVWQGRNGEFWLEFLAPNPYLRALEIYTVDKIRGYFAPSSLAIEGEEWQASPAPPIGNQHTEYPVFMPLSALRVAALNDVGQLIYADSENSQHAFRVAGLLMQSATPPGFGKILTDGRVSDSSWDWEIGRPIFVGSSGRLTQTPPETGFLLQVGIPATPQTIDFEIQEPILI